MHIYLSPHFDDVCFSIGWRAAQTGGALVNAFTRSDYVARPDIVVPAGERGVAFVSTMREGEDASFALAAGLVRHDLGLDDAGLDGSDPFDPAGLEQHAASLAASLSGVLHALLPESGGAVVHSPIGIGGHRDHLAMALAAFRLCREMPRAFAMLFYEDLPYAHRPASREQGLARLAALHPEKRLVPEITVLDGAAAATKLTWIQGYASQHPRPPRPADFVPASGLAPGLHEIEWRIAGAGDQIE